MSRPTFSPNQFNAIVLTTRISGIFSFIGVLFILSTFLLGRGFDKPINRLIFYSCFSNLVTNIGTMIARDGLLAGQNTSLCQFQGWAFQMFLGVDAYWAFCMAFNVYLALFHKWTASRLRKHEWKYFVACYGLSAIPAVVYLCLHSTKRGKVYGPALLWCWVTTPWAFLRFATFYAIIWLALLSAFGIYCVAFRKVWKQRHELHGLFNPFNEDPFAHTVTTDIEIVHTSRARKSTNSNPQLPDNNHPVDPSGLTLTPANDAEGPLVEVLDPYTVAIGVGPRREDIERRGDRPQVFRLGELTRHAALSEVNPDAWLYARVSFLYFCALLISWLPASINRLHSLVNPEFLNFGINYTESLLFPLQGFFNAIVYCVTSQTACRNLWRSMLGKPEIPMRNVSTMGVSGKGWTSNLGSLGKGGGEMGSGGLEGKLDRYSSRKASQRLDSDGDSVANLTAVYHGR